MYRFHLSPSHRLSAATAPSDEGAFCGGTKAPPYNIAIGALPLHGLHGWRNLEHEIEK